MKKTLTGIFIPCTFLLLVELIFYIADYKQGCVWWIYAGWVAGFWGRILSKE